MTSGFESVILKLYLYTREVWRKSRIHSYTHCLYHKVVHLYNFHMLRYKWFRKIHPDILHTEKKVIDKKGDFLRKFLGCKWKCRIELNKSRSLYAKCEWNWPSGSGEEDFLISSINFNNSHLSTLLKTYHPTVNVFLLFRNLWKCAWPLLWTNWHPSTPQDA